MNIEKYTINASKRIGEAQDTANKKRHSQISPLHLLYAMLTSDDSIVKEILLEYGVDLQILTSNTKKEIINIPTIDGNYNLNLSNELNTVFIEAEKIAERMKDDYITEEHLLLAIIDDSDSKTKNIIESLGISSPKIKEIIEKMRGGEKVSDNDPESKMNSLKKYGIDLIELAKKGKIDPVIGREEENKKNSTNTL